MKRRAGKYFFSLLVTGIIFFLVTAGIVLLTVMPLYDSSIYDFGVSSLFTGIVIATLSFFLLFSGSSWLIRLQKYLPLEARWRGVRDRFRDLLWTVMITSIFLSLTGYSLININLEQGIRTPNPETRPYIGSLRSELKLHEEYAKQQWANDAFLSRSTLWIGDNTRWRVESVYYSLLKSKETIYIYTRPDGSITSRVYENNDSRVPEYSIRYEDWQISSQEAFNIFLEDEEIRRCVMSNLDASNVFYRGIELTLDRASGLEDYYVYWALRLPDNCNIEHHTIYMNAKTGEITGKR